MSPGAARLRSFQRRCNACEALSMSEKMGLLTERSAAVLRRLRALDRPEPEPESVLAGLILGALVVDGAVDEKEYLMLYPALLRIFGDDFDFAPVKRALDSSHSGKKAITAYAEQLLCTLGSLDEPTKEDILTLCLCATALDGHISYREKRYLRHLWETL